jgi:putative DNA primase/helicase
VPTTRLNPDRIPEELKAIDQWVVWKYLADDLDRVSKPSYSALEPSERAWPNQPESWAPFRVARRVWGFGGLGFDGIAIVLTADLGIVGVDIDHLSRWERPSEAWDIVRTLDSYTEVSPGEDGYRIFCYGALPEGRRRREFVDMFDDGRIFTVTGRTMGVSPHLEHRQVEIEQVHHLWLGTDYALPKPTAW